jgi:predicted dehydrogenase
MIPFGIVGTGWRSLFYLRIARACPARFKVVGLVSRDPAGVTEAVKSFGAPLYNSVETLLKTAKPKPMFMVTSVPWAVNPGLMWQLAKLNLPILSETPPATTVKEMRDLLPLVKQGAQIQVAEQYWAQPHHAARLALAHSGKLGQLSQVQVSAAHGYHGISLIRRFLGVGFENPKVNAFKFSSAIVQSPNRAGPPPQEAIVSSDQVIAYFDFGDRLGVFDFSGDQYFSYIRGQRLLVRGERGEIINDTAVYLQDHVTPVRVTFTRHEAGPNGNLEGFYLKGIQAGESWLYRNPLAPGELSDDEIAIGTCLLKMADYVKGSLSFYSLAEACQDRYLHILIEQSLSKGRPVVAETQPWAEM